MIALIRIIQALSCQFNSKLDSHYALTQSLWWLLLYVQKPTFSNEDYHKDFEALVKTIKTQWGKYVEAPGLV